MSLKLIGRYFEKEILRINTDENVFKLSLFDRNEKVKAIIFPETCTEIKSSCGIFQLFPKLEEVIWPNIKKMNRGMFAYCEKLKYFQAVSCSTFPEEAFMNTHLLKITLPSDITTLEEDCFKGCFFLKTVDMSQVKSKIVVSDYCFSRCDKLSDFDFNKCKYIGKYAFNGCKINKAIFNDSEGECCQIKSFAFANSFLSYLEISNNIKVEEYSFGNCTYLKEVKINKGIQSLPFHLFYRDINLSKITGAEDIEEVGKFCFCNCSLSSLDAFVKLKKIDYAAFFGNRFEEITTSADIIEKDAFSMCLQLNKITLTSPNIKSFPLSAFDLKKITSLDLSHTNIDVIPKSAFEESQIKEIFLPHNLKVIESKAFYKSEIEKIIIPYTVTKVEHEAFFDCHNLKKIVWSPNCKRLSESVTAYCKNLQEFIGSEYIEAIDDYALEQIAVNMSFPILKAANDFAFYNYLGTADLRKSCVMLDKSKTILINSNILLPYFYEQSGV